MPGGSIQRDRIDPSLLPFYHGWSSSTRTSFPTDHAILLEASSRHYSILLQLASYPQLHPHQFLSRMAVNFHMSLYQKND
ncbi:hypothetical protein BDA96_03G079300 [Sorghum bicolor]|uniref:Uncharacterized protein n=2 Tax=Sorghum bicolor TaxID=4558 RepID=A0A1B6Q1V4_SORBI|nr:hypothetical protein BDA96_03G079300 [Sorghum bicolor]KXG31907.1 hypothetical protein SORBI_3003G075700 [Sorghum bicolor]KXG31908.1 hypothetical protein SORBI_3003G075700 [Sorghum bicolor]